MNDNSTKNSSDKSDAKLSELLTFFMSGVFCGILPGELLEIVEENQYVPVPNSPDFLKGIINSHGKVITVVDLTKILVDENLSLGAKRRIAVLKNEDFNVGVLVPLDLEISFYPGEKISLDEKTLKFFKKFKLKKDNDDITVSILDSNSVYEFLRNFFKNKTLQDW